jgi:hypothetical protein
MSEPTTSKRATNPKDEDYSALKHTKFMFCVKLHQWRQVGLAVVMGPCMNYWVNVASCHGSFDRSWMHESHFVAAVGGNKKICQCYGNF